MMTANTSSSGSKLLVVQTRDDGPTTPDMDVVVIDDVLGEMTIDDYDRIYRLLSNAGIELDSSIPVYDISWQHILVSRRGRLLELVLVYQGLRSVIEAKQPTVIVCGRDVDLGYASVLQDLGTEYGISIENAPVFRRSIARVKRFLTSTLLLLPFVLDQLFSLAYNAVKPASEETDTLFVPALGRLDSMTPVLDRATGDSKVLVHSNASSWFWLASHSDLDEYDPIAVSKFTSLRVLREQFGIYLSICQNVLFGTQLKERLESVLQSNVGIAPDQTIDYALLSAFRTRIFLSLMLNRLFGGVISELEPKQVIVGTLAPEGKSIIYSALSRGVDIYHVPHSIATWQCPNPPPELTQFVAGELDKRYQSESQQVQDPWHQVVTGRPYLSNLYQQRSEGRNSTTGEAADTLRMVIATQPFDVSVAFVDDIIQAAERAEPPVEIVIKTHPSENRDQYRHFESRLVDVVEHDLFDHLRWADLTVTISSNVGLESILLGTPCACYNRWSPMRQPPPYARYGAVPVLDGTDAMVELLDAATGCRFPDLQAEQADFVHESYKLEGDAAERIVEYLESRQSP